MLDKQLEARLQEAQFSIVGSMLIDDRCIGDVLANISVEDFPNGVYRSIFDTMRQLFCAGRPVDPVIVLDAMQGGKQLQSCIMQCMEVTPTSANVLEYCRILRELSRVSRLQEIGLALTSAASLDEAGKLVSQANGLMVQQFGVLEMDASQLMMDFYRRMHDDKKPDYIRCGIAEIDRVLYLELGDMVGIGAAPSTGKTAFALQWAAKLAPSYRVGFYSLETGPAKVTDRMIAQMAHQPLATLKDRCIGEKDWERIGEVSNEFSKGDFKFVQASGMSVEDIISHAVSRRRQIIFVDYLQLVGSSTRNKTSSLDVVTHTSMMLHQAAQQHNMLVVALSQLSRPEKVNGKYRPPDMHSFRESGQIEQDLDVALLLYLDDPDNYRSDRICKVGKNKEGEKARVQLAFDGRYQRFYFDTAAEIQRIAKAEQQKAKKEKQAQAEQEPEYPQQQFTEITGRDADLPVEWRS